MPKPILKRAPRRTRPPARNVRDVTGARVRLMVTQDAMGRAALEAEGGRTSPTQRKIARKASPKFQAAKREYRVAKADLLRVKAGKRSKGKKARIEPIR